ncbi:hypothetical protein Trydic_g18567 [Trypoxylus dichotomus]
MSFTASSGGGIAKGSRGCILGTSARGGFNAGSCGQEPVCFAVHQQSEDPGHLSSAIDDFDIESKYLNTTNGGLSSSKVVFEDCLNQ